MKKTHQHTGVTLIELLIAVTISSILLLGVGSVYYNSKRTYLVQEEFAQLQEGARIAVKFMVDDIRMAGYIGCAWNNNLDYQNFLNPTGVAADDEAFGNFLVGIVGFDATNSGPGLPAVNLAGPAAGYTPVAIPTLNPAANPGSDIILVRHASGNGARITASNTADNLWFDNQFPTLALNTAGNNCHTASGICEGDILLVTDCRKSRLFQTTAGMLADANGINIVHVAAGSPGNAIPDWNGATGGLPVFEPDDSYVFKAVSYAYYIANNAVGEPSLFRMPMLPNAVGVELITGVENMQILYGIDTDKTAATQSGDGIANRYVSAVDVVPAIDNIVSTRISLLIRTTNETSTKSTATATSKNYILAGMNTATGTTVTTIPDRRLRKVFTTTIKIRNKGIQ